MPQRDIESQLNILEVTRRFRSSAMEREMVKEQLKLGKSPIEIEREDRVKTRVTDLGIDKTAASDYARNIKATPNSREARGIPRPKNPGLERLVGKNDLLSSVFLERGAEATKPVCCIRERDTRIGTGFLVAPRLLITNAHVIDSDNASICRAEFNYEDRLIGEGSEKSAVFDLAPGELFFSSPADDLDYTLVAVKPTSNDKTLSERRSLLDFGHLPLNPSVANALRGECLNILQHPDGAPKRIALRQNRFTALLDHFVHYESDTLPGSSGSPVFNDQWEVICLHHAGVPLKDADDNILTLDNRIWNEDADDPALIKWIGNEGIRISRILADLITKANAKYGSDWPDLLDHFPRKIDNPPHVDEKLVIDSSVQAQSLVQPPKFDTQTALSSKPSDGQDVTVTITIGDSDAIVVKVSNAAQAITEATGDRPVIRSKPLKLVDRGLHNFERAKTRIYYDKQHDGIDRTRYYNDINPKSPALDDDLATLLTDTHKNQLSYKVARIEHLYAWVDLQRGKEVCSIYSDELFDPRKFITEDFTIERRVERIAERRLVKEANFSTERLEQVIAKLEAMEPFNCEHVVPQSWFEEDAPMQGDLHHLFACESKCNSFRGNRPYMDFGKFDIEQEAVKPRCGFVERDLFEPFMGKGKVARATLYFLLRYRGRFDNMYDGVEDGILNLLDWHESSSVSEHELHRNQAIFDIQGNRNPFIDHPEWARIVFRS